MNTLLKFAYSLRIRARFFNGQRVVIDPVPNIKRAINLPASPEEYESLVKGLAQDRGFMLKPGEGSPGKHVSSEYAKSTGKAPTMKSATHCECALVLADSDAFKRGIASTASITSPRKKKKGCHCPLVVVVYDMITPPRESLVPIQALASKSVGIYQFLMSIVLLPLLLSCRCRSQGYLFRLSKSLPAWFEIIAQ